MNVSTPGQRLGLAAAAAELGVHRRTLLFAIHAQKLRAERIGAQWVVTRRALAAWQREARHLPGPVPRGPRQHG